MYDSHIQDNESVIINNIKFDSDRHALRRQVPHLPECVPEAVPLRAVRRRALLLEQGARAQGPVVQAVRRIAFDHPRSEAPHRACETLSEVLANSQNW